MRDPMILIDFSFLLEDRLVAGIDLKAGHLASHRNSGQVAHKKGVIDRGML